MENNLTNLTKKQKCLEAYKNSKCNISKACESINISRDTFYRWEKKYPKFAKQMLEIEESFNDKIEGVLFRKAEMGHQRAVEFWLLNHKREKYANKNELTGAGGEPLNLKFIIERSNEDERNQSKTDSQTD